MKKLKRAVNKEEFFAITGDTVESLILNQFLYWSERVKDFDKFIEEENQRQEKYKDSPEKAELIHGWIYKKALEMKDEIMVSDSEKTINRKIDKLVEKGFLDRRNNPEYKYDRTYQYRVNFENIIKALVEKGYVLEGYKVNIEMYKNLLNASDTNKGQNDESNLPNDIESKRQIDDLKRQLDLSKELGDGAIPKTTTETTTNITSSSKEEVNPIITLFKEIKGDINVIEKINLNKLIEQHPEELVVKAIEVAAVKAEHFNLDYVKSCLKDWEGQTVAEVEKALSKASYSSKKGIEKQQSTFNNFKQRDYDFDKLKKQLLGWEE